jgi:hypothetical protein
MQRAAHVKLCCVDQHAAVDYHLCWHAYPCLFVALRRLYTLCLRPIDCKLTRIRQFSDWGAVTGTRVLFVGPDRVCTTVY